MMVPVELSLEKGTIIYLPGNNSKIIAIVDEIISEPTDPVKRVLLSSPVNVQNLKWVQVLKKLMKAIDFKIEKKLDGSLGRAGILSTPHGDIKTPSLLLSERKQLKVFVPEQLKDNNIQVVLANTYHLYLQPGDEFVREAGGLHKFMNWNGPMMTDSGLSSFFFRSCLWKRNFKSCFSYRSISIPERSSADDGVPRLATIGNDGVSFRSHIDGSLHYITPEKSIEIQHNLEQILFLLSMNVLHQWKTKDIKKMHFRVLILGPREV